jgi:hypothetical protein
LHVGRAARIAAALAFLTAVAPLAPTAYAVVSIRCCGSGAADPAGWVLIGLVIVLAALVPPVLAGAVVELYARKARCRSK